VSRLAESNTETIGKPLPFNRPAFRGSIYDRIHGRRDICSVSRRGCLLWQIKPLNSVHLPRSPPYDYTPLKIGLVLLSFGGGNVLGSVMGGRYSDMILRKLKKKNGGDSEPEMRLQSTVLGECCTWGFNVSR